ncbi:MAG: sensor histidine kinase [Candidatus Eiseniibacteriota bacterium]
MHPILAGRLRQLLYLGVWLGVGGLLGAVLELIRPRPLGTLVLFLAPLLVFYAFACLSAWWVCRANPPATTLPERLLAVIAGASAQASLMWMLLGAFWAVILSRAAHLSPDRAAILRDVAVLGVAGFVLYAQSMAGHYFLLTIENAREAERLVLTSQVSAREAELRALRAQLNPHFLFNSLNSISSLAGSDPESARRMCQLLGDFLRSSLSLGARHRVAFKEELALAERYLAVEQVRFGERLMFEKHVQPEAERCQVPPLLIQPLIENAVKHGVADRIEGGTVSVTATVRDGSLEISVENPRDPDAPPRRGQGLGLDNVRQRLTALDSRHARLDVFSEAQAYRVRLCLPASMSEAGATRD